MSVPTPREPERFVAERDSRARAATVGRGTFRTASACLDLAVASCRGKRQAVNEDAHSALDGRVPVYVVADGVGGGAMASRASRELVARVHRALDGGRIDDDAVREALLEADREVARSIANHTDQLGAATVALCASAEPDLASWVIAWVGDCRVYRVAAPGGREAEPITQDDTYRHLSETPPPGSSLDDPARMIGNGAVTVPNLTHVALHDDELLVLCSDGVHKHVQARDISHVLRANAVSLARRCASLIALARTRGSTDDATVLVVHRAVHCGAHRANR
ncbi:MAG: protein serine/threonine phosphatase 2C family protein [Betaproteobacteria bacterium]|nr:protein serine/threonine phosphatase 2C family protein [Betaproteobacteria bacterium]